MCAGARSRRGLTHDQRRVPHQAVRPLHGRRPRVLHGRDGPGHRLPRPQRCRQVHHHARHGRPHPAQLRPRHHLRPRLPRARQPRPRGRRPAGRLRPARRAHRPRDPRHRRSRPWACRSRGSPRPSPASASPTTRPGAGSATTPSACASASASPPPSSATREVLILDEPANGLDPAGIRWMRDLLRGFADDGGTVLLSSHLLHEIEVIADDIVVIGQGRIVAQGSKSELLAAAGTLVRTADPSTASPVPCTRRPSSPPRSTAACASTPTPSSWARRHTAPASSCASCAPPTAPAWRRCSSSSPPRPLVKEQQHDHRTADHHPGPRRRRHAAPAATAAPRVVRPSR